MATNLNRNHFGHDHLLTGNQTRRFFLGKGQNNHCFVGNPQRPIASHETGPIKPTQGIALGHNKGGQRLILIQIFA